MKLKLTCTAALVMFATTAHAQSSVTLYGVLDTGLLYQGTSAATFLPHVPNTGQPLSATNDRTMNSRPTIR